MRTLSKLFLCKLPLALSRDKDESLENRRVARNLIGNFNEIASISIGIAVLSEIEFICIDNQQGRLLSRWSRHMRNTAG